MEAENQYKKGLWTEEEDKVLLEYIKVHGRGQWNRIPKATGLKRRGKSCRLRWLNNLNPNIKRGGFSEEEDDLIIRLHNLIGNRWSLIAGRVPGRTDNQVKNHWNTHLCKKLGINKKQQTTRKLVVAVPNNTSRIPHHHEDQQQQQGAGVVLSKNNSKSKLHNVSNSSVEAMEVVPENKTKPALINDAGDHHHHHHQASNEETVELGDKSLLFFNDDYMLINSPCIVDFPDAFSLDLMCPSL